MGGLSRRWGAPPWRVELELQRAPLPRRCAVAVVGAGLTGLSAAWHLARRGVEVVALEAGRVGDGASGRTGGLVLEETAAGALPLVERCIPALERLLADTSIECGLRLDGCLELTHEAGARGRLLGRDGDGELRVRAEVPGGLLDPGALLAGLARAALAAGARIAEGARVDLDPERPHRLRVEDATLEADFVLLALNAFTARALPAADQSAALTLAACTGPLPAGALAALGLDRPRGFYTVDLPYLWGRPVSGGRLLLGSGLVHDAAGDPERIDVGAGDARSAFERLEARVRGLHESLSGARLERRWGGPVAFRASRRPLLARHPASERVILTGAYAGHGVALAPRIGEIAAGAIASDGALPDWGALDTA